MIERKPAYRDERMIRIVSKTICKDCAKKSEMRKRAYDSSDHHILQDMGPDSICDFCYKENGGSVIFVKQLL